MAEQRRGLLVSKGWVQMVILVVLFGFFVLGLLAYRTYQAKPPIPARVVDPGAAALHRRRRPARTGGLSDNGLMEYGSVFGHGAYLGPDYTADYLRRAANQVTAQLRWRALRHARLSARSRTSGPTATTTNRRADLHRGAGGGPPPARGALLALLLRTHDQNGLRPDAITDRADLAELTAFFAWTAWAGAAERPGHNYSYTNNWPPEPRVDNRPTADVVVWSVLSLIALLGGIGLLFAAFGRWNSSAGTAANRPRSASASPATWPSPPRSAPAPGSSS